MKLYHAYGGNGKVIFCVLRGIYRGVIFAARTSKRQAAIIVRAYVISMSSDRSRIQMRSNEGPKSEAHVRDIGDKRFDSRHF